MEEELRIKGIYARKAREGNSHNENTEYDVWEIRSAKTNCLMNPGYLWVHPSEQGKQELEAYLLDYQSS